MNFSIIIPNYNGEAFLDSCLNSIIKSAKLCSNLNIEVIVVDNASKDNSLSIIKKYLEIANWKLEIVFLQKNHGFGYAINQGVKKSQYENLLIINNDIIIDKNWFKNIVKAVNSNPNYACYYGLVLNKDGTKIESSGFKFYKSGKAININNNKKYQRSKSYDLNPVSIWGAPASIVIYKREIFNKLNGFDEQYFAYIEDVDLCYRLNKNNYQTLFIPSAISYHTGGATSSKVKYLREWMTVKNWWIFIFKNYSTKEIIINFFPIIFERLRNLKYLLIKLAHL